MPFHLLAKKDLRLWAGKMVKIDFDLRESLESRSYKVTPAVDLPEYKSIIPGPAIAA